MGYKIVILAVAIVAVLFTSGLALDAFAYHEPLDSTKYGYFFAFNGNNDSYGPGWGVADQFGNPRVDILPKYFSDNNGQYNLGKWEDMHENRFAAPGFTGWDNMRIQMHTQLHDNGSGLAGSNKVTMVAGYSFGGASANWITSHGINSIYESIHNDDITFNLVWLVDPVGHTGTRHPNFHECITADAFVITCTTSAPARLVWNNVKYHYTTYQTDAIPPIGDKTIRFNFADPFIPVRGTEKYDCDRWERHFEINEYNQKVIHNGDGITDDEDQAWLEAWAVRHLAYQDQRAFGPGSQWQLEGIPYPLHKLWLENGDATTAEEFTANAANGKEFWEYLDHNGVGVNSVKEVFKWHWGNTFGGLDGLNLKGDCHGKVGGNNEYEAFGLPKQTDRMIGVLEIMNAKPILDITTIPGGSFPSGEILEIDEGTPVKLLVSATDALGFTEYQDKMELNFRINPQNGETTPTPSPVESVFGTGIQNSFEHPLDTSDGNETGTIIENEFQVEDARFPCDYCTDGTAGNSTTDDNQIGQDDAMGSLGKWDRQQVTIKVNNVPPTVSGFASFQDLDLKLLLKTTDPSETDTLAGFNYTVDWGDGSPIQNIQGSIPGNVIEVFSHSYTPGIYNVTVHATDKDNGVSDEFSIEVATPFAKLLKLIQNLKDDGTLNKGNANSFTAKVNTVIGSMEKQNYNPVCNVANALINEIKQGFEKPGKLSLAISDELIEKIHEEREPFGCNGGVIDIVKQTIPDGDTTQFSFTGDVSGTIGDGEKIRLGNLTSGTYSSTETVPSGWELANILCIANDYTKDLTTNSTTINLQENDYAVCVFFNVIDEEMEPSFAGRGFGSASSETAISDIRLHSSNPSSAQPSDDLTDDKKGSGGDEHLTRPTFGVSHETFETIVDSGFRFNDQSFTINDNHHTPFAQQTVNIGEINSFEAKIYADKRLKIQEFLFGIPNVGEAHLAELGVEIWYDYNGEIEEVKAIQKSNVIDKETIVATHQKTKCQSSDIEQKCDTTNVSMVFLEPLKDKVMAVKAIDYKGRYQITYLNEGVEIAGESLNSMNTFLIPSKVKGEGLVQVTQTAKYSPYWLADDGRLFEMNSFGSFKQINQTFERFEDTGNPYTRVHSGFGGIIAYEQKRANQVFDSNEYISELPDSFAYVFPEPYDRMTDDMKAKMLEQEEIAKKIIEESKVQARW